VHCHGNFAYRTSRPDGADLKEVDAQLTGGILPVHLPKGARPAPRQPEDRGWVSRVARPTERLPAGGGRYHKMVTLLPRPAWPVQAG